MTFETRFIERFWQRVSKAGENDCWEWNRGKTGNVYGQLRIANNQAFGTHVFSYILHKGPVPAGLWVLHTCDNRRCVNPNHLYAGTPLQNMRDCSNRGRLKVPELRGERCPAAKLTEDDVRAIRKASGTNKELGEKYNVHSSLISCIQRRVIWKSVA